MQLYECLVSSIEGNQNERRYRVIICENGMVSAPIKALTGCKTIAVSDRLLVCFSPNDYSIGYIVGVIA